MTNFISIGCQSGGPNSGGIGEIKVRLYHAFSRHVTSTHCAAIDEYGLVLRVDGAFAKFGSEGIARLRLAKKSRYITADIQIPENVWMPKSECEIMLYLSDVVRRALVQCVLRLKKDKYNVSEVALFTEVDTAITDFLTVAGTGLTTQSSGTSV